MREPLYVAPTAPLGVNVLVNGDLSMCNGTGWQRFPLGPTNIAVYNAPAAASNPPCYLATNCGQASCQPGQSIFQDVAIGDPAGRSLAFGGKFATDAGVGRLDVAVFEFDAGGRVLTSHAIAVEAGPSYRAFERAVALRPETRTLRYQLYLSTPHTFRADEMFARLY